jgi:hypothetical protein
MMMTPLDLKEWLGQKILLNIDLLMMMMMTIVFDY